MTYEKELEDKLSSLTLKLAELKEEINNFNFVVNQNNMNVPSWIKSRIYSFKMNVENIERVYNV